MLFRKSDKDGVSPFRAVTLALAGTLGVGNIVGVAGAITLGGFGSIFWMWMSAVAAMVLKYAEILLAVSHRRIDAGGRPFGGTMFYIRDCFERKKLYSIAKILSIIFAVLCVVNAVTMGCVVQVNSISNAFDGVFGINPLTVGILLALLSAFILKLGADKISALTEVLVPIMSIGYIVFSLWIIVVKRENIGNAISAILGDAFSFDSAMGGVVGFLTSRALRFGTIRGILSNEAGCGTAPIAHAASNTKEPVEQGIWGVFEVFVDTILLCTMTALVIVLSFEEVYLYGTDSVMMTIRAYGVVLGDFAEYFLTVAVFLFGFATVICWSHYGAEAIKYISKKKKILIAYYFVYIASIVIGAIVAPDLMWSVADFAIGAMTLINLTVLFAMRHEIKRETLTYFNKKRPPE